MESGLELHVFLHRFFMLYLYFPVYLEKKNRATFSPQARTNPFSTNMRLIRMNVSGGGGDSFMQLLYKFAGGGG